MTSSKNRGQPLGPCLCYCISPPWCHYYIHYTDEETEVQRGGGTFPSFYCTGLSEFYPHGEGQQVGHIPSLPWFWLVDPEETADHLHNSTFPVSKMGLLCSGWPGTVQWQTPSPLCVAQGKRQASTPTHHNRSMNPPAFLCSFLRNVGH